MPRRNTSHVAGSIHMPEIVRQHALQHTPFTIDLNRHRVHPEPGRSFFSEGCSSDIRISSAGSGSKQSRPTQHPPGFESGPLIAIPIGSDVSRRDFASTHRSSGSVRDNSPCTLSYRSTCCHQRPRLPASPAPNPHRWFRHAYSVCVSRCSMTPLTPLSLHQSPLHHSSRHARPSPGRPAPGLHPLRP